MASRSVSTLALIPRRGLSPVEIAEFQDLLDAHDRVTAELAEALSLSPERIRLAADALAKRLGLDPLECLSAARYTPERGGGAAATELARRCWQLAATLEGLDRSLSRYATFVDDTVGPRRREYIAAELERPSLTDHEHDGRRAAMSPRDAEMVRLWRDEGETADAIGNLLGRLSGKRVRNRLSELRQMLCEECVPNRGRGP